MRVVVNSSPFIALGRIGQLHLLKALYGTVVRPQAVLDELLAGDEKYPVSRELRDAEWIVTEADPPEIALRKDLGPGETAVIALALNTGADLVILDDLQARLLAASLNLNLTGTLGVLLGAHQLGLLPDIQGALMNLLHAGFHLPPSIVAQYGLA
jgi:predicted nucleic acid-binding protein